MTTQSLQDSQVSQPMLAILNHFNKLPWYPQQQKLTSTSAFYLPTHVSEHHLPEPPHRCNLQQFHSEPVTVRELVNFARNLTPNMHPKAPVFRNLACSLTHPPRPEPSITLHGTCSGTLPRTLPGTCSVTTQQDQNLEPCPELALQRPSKTGTFQNFARNLARNF